MNKIFIGCASESIGIAQTIQLRFSKQKNKPLCIIWDQGVFKPGEYVIPSLIKQIGECDYAIFIFSSDDVTLSRGKKKNTARDNVIYECGLATGILGEKNCFILKSQKTSLPSDFNGLTTADYDEEQYKENPEAALGHAVTEFTTCIETGVKNSIPMFSWRQYLEAVESICAKIRRSPRQGGFRFDVIIGISRGGIIAADLINRRFLAEKPLLCLWGDYKSRQPEIDFLSEDASINNHIIDAIADEMIKNVLIVDDITRCGRTVIAAKDMISERCPNKCVKSAVLFVPKEHKKKVDFHAVEIDNKSIAMPYAILD